MMVHDGGTPRLTVVYTGEADELFDFPADGCRRTFGRDDERCDIIIWSALNGLRLARVAGEVFRMDGELWVRNLAQSHALHLQAPGRPPEPELPPRRSTAERGAARSIPGPECLITGPDGCELLVHQELFPLDLEHDRVGSVPPRMSEPTRFAVPAVPEHLRAVAVAICAPLLHGERFPAAYSEVAETLKLTSARAARRLVDELCAYYDDAQAGDAQVDGGMPARTQPVTSMTTPQDLPPVKRRQVLTLPAYYDLAHLLINHHRLTVEDLTVLFPPQTQKPRRPGRSRDHVLVAAQPDRASLK